MWPAEHFAVVANHLIQRFDAGVIVLSGPGRTQETETLLSKVAARDRVRALSGLSIPQLAAAIGSAQLLISNDTGPMHLGPTFGVPTIGIFSVGIPKHFRPTGAADCVVEGKPIEKIRPERIIENVDRIWASVR
jgi:heptosyltransferase-2